MLRLGRFRAGGTIGSGSFTIANVVPLTIGCWKIFGGIGPVPLGYKDMRYCSVGLVRCRVDAVVGNVFAMSQYWIRFYNHATSFRTQGGR
jgi:hypothetical protein